LTCCEVAAGQQGPSVSPSKSMGAKCAGQRRHPSRSSACKHTSRTLSVGGTHPDVKRFDAALKGSDINAFVGLLSSKCAIAPFEEPLHPWAKNPTTIGALAAVQLAIMAENSAETQAKIGIGEAGAMELLLEFFESKQEDRQHCAMVALHDLVDDSPENVSLAVDAGAIDILMNHVDSPLLEARMLVANIFRRIFVWDHGYRDEFVKKGGISFFVKQILSAAEMPDMPNVQLDAVLNMLDLLQDHDGQAIPELVLQVRNAGIEADIRVMQTDSDDDLNQSVLELLEIISEGDSTRPRQAHSCSMASSMP